MDRSKLTAYAGREQASVKHFLLESYLERLVMITAQARYDRIAYVDAFAGPWKSALDDLSDTSFAKAIEVMEGCRVHLARRFGRSVSFRALFVERDPERFTRLKRFADQRTSQQIEIEAINEDFSESSASVANWLRDDEMAFVLIDPTGWKDVIAPRTLKPLLTKSNVELLINVMWNFISLASGHVNQEKNLRDLVGDDYKQLTAEGSIKDGQNWMRAYLRQLAVNAVVGGTARAHTAWFPVEFATKDRVFYYLVYWTHHLKGMITFLEESERAASFQTKVKFVVHQRERESKSGIADIFGDELHGSQKADLDQSASTREAWLSLLPRAGDERKVDEACIADLAQRCGCLLSVLQESLRTLIAEGILRNLDATRPRPRNVVNYRKGERLRRIK
jgi:three-Cys-motif partner protein